MAQSNVEADKVVITKTSELDGGPVTWQINCGDCHGEFTVVLPIYSDRLSSYCPHCGANNYWNMWDSYSPYDA